MKQGDVLNKKYTLKRSRKTDLSNQTWQAENEKGTTVILKFIKFPVRSEQQIAKQKIIFEKARHQNMVHIFESFTCQLEANRFLVIAMEQCPDGDFARIIQGLADGTKKLQLTNKLKYMVQIAKGLQYLHKYQIAHRNIKPQNIFKMQDTAKIGDLDLAGIYKIKSTQQLSGGAAFPLYKAPEVYQQNVYYLQSDIWSLGLVFLEFILQLRLKYRDRWKMQPCYQREQIERLAEKIKSMNSNLYDIIMGMLQIDKKRRITAGVVVCRLEKLVQQSEALKKPTIKESEMRETYLKLYHFKKQMTKQSEQAYTTEESIRQPELITKIIKKQQINRQEQKGQFTFSLMQQEGVFQQMGEQEYNAYLPKKDMKMKKKYKSQWLTIKTRNQQARLKIRYISQNDLLIIHYGVYEEILSMQHLPAQIRLNWETVQDLYMNLERLKPEQTTITEQGVIKFKAKKSQNYESRLRQYKQKISASKQQQHQIPEDESLNQYNNNNPPNTLRKRQPKSENINTLQYNDPYLKKILIQIQQLQKQIEILQKTTSKNNLKAVYDKIGLKYMEIEQYQKAAQYFQKIIQVNPISIDSANAYLNLGSCYSPVGSAKEAIDCFTKSLNIKRQLSISNPADESIVLNCIGLAYRNVGKYFEAKSNYQKALDKIKSMVGQAGQLRATILANLGQVYMLEKQYSKSIQLLSNSKREFGQFNISKPCCIKVEINFMEVYFLMGKFKECLATIKQLLSKNITQSSHYVVTKEKIIMKITEIMTGTTNKEYLKEIKSIVLTYLKDEKGLLGSVNDQLAKFK